MLLQMVKKIFTLLALITVLPAGSKSEQPMTENAPVLTVCQVLSNAFLYDGKFIRIRDRVVSTEEGSWLKSDKCPGVFKTLLSKTAFGRGLFWTGNARSEPDLPVEDEVKAT